MSIHHDVTIHCDTCGWWEHGDRSTTARRRKRGWVIWQDEESGRWQHTCPNCNTQPHEQEPQS